MAYQRTRVTRSMTHAVVAVLDLTYHSIVKNVRDQSGGALLGLLNAMMKMMIMFIFFFLLMVVFGMKSVPIRGDFVIYMMSGIFMFFVHNNAISATSAATPLNAMQRHAPMTGLITGVSANLAQLYIMSLAGALILGLALLLREGAEIAEPINMAAMVFLAAGTGVGIGLLFNLITPFAPNLIGSFRTLYMRLNMITSGKMFLANLIPAKILPFFDWNPLFHVIDQARGFAFVNYFPRNSNLDYPFYLMLVLLAIGLIGTHWLKRTTSASQGARATF